MQEVTTPKFRTRYNWEALKIEFMQGPFKTVTEFLRFKGFPVKSRYFIGMCKVWGREKQKIIVKAIKKKPSELVSMKVAEIKKINNRHSSLGKYMQLRGAEALKKLEPKTIEDARKLIQTGIETERNAMGLNEKGGNPSSLTQVNVNVPKTRFDEMLDAGNVEEILKLAADIRRERIRRSGKGGIVEGEIENQ